jgi:hypothetical protein
MIIFNRYYLNLKPDYMKKILYTLFFGLLIIGCNTSSDSIDDTPEPTAPTLFTTEVTSITHNSANSGGNELNDNGSDITAKGVCWSIQPNIPTIDDAHTTDGAGMPPYMSGISGLEPNTDYFVRAYAINAIGIGYGEKLPFTTANEPGSPPCNPATNSATFNSMVLNYDITTAGTTNLSYGEYGLIGTNSDSNLHVEFKEPPTTGVYISVEPGSVIFNSNCVISGLFGGEDYLVAAEELVYVVKNGEGQYSITLCGVTFFSTATADSFATNANLTSQ